MTESTYRHQAVAHQLRRMLAEGHLVRGDRLPPERDLAVRFGVSRNCVRQALQTLRHEERLESRRGAGTFVALPDADASAQALAKTIEAQQARLREVIAFRRLLEPQIARLAAAHIDRDRLQRLKAIVCDQDRCQVKGRSDANLDAAFHRSLAEATGNRVVLEVFRTLETLLDESRADFLRTDRRRRMSVIGHMKIIDALERRDGEAAARAMDEHLRAVDRVLIP